MHVRDLVANAVVDHLSGDVPGLGDRVFRDGSVGWDRETFPWAVVKAGAMRVAVEDGSAGGLQRRDMDVSVEIHDLETGAADYVARIGDMAVAVEAQMHALPDAVGIEACVVTGDSGVQDIDLDARGMHAGIAVSFTVSFYTPSGRADALVAP